MPDLSGFADPGAAGLGRLHGDGHYLTALTDATSGSPDAPASSPGPPNATGRGAVGRTVAVIHIGPLGRAVRQRTKAIQLAS